MLVLRDSLPSLLLSPLLSPLSVFQLSWAGPGVHFTAEPTEPPKPIMGIGLAEATPGLSWSVVTVWPGMVALPHLRRTSRTGPGQKGRGTGEARLTDGEILSLPLQLLLWA